MKPDEEIVEEMRKENFSSINYNTCTSSRIEAFAAQSNSFPKPVNLQREIVAIHRGQQQNSFNVFCFICWSLVSFALGVYEDPLIHFHSALFCDISLQIFKQYMNKIRLFCCIAGMMRVFLVKQKMVWKEINVTVSLVSAFVLQVQCTGRIGKGKDFPRKQRRRIVW